ncbi:hypothetical protein ABZ793_24450 [Micromonospora sp. NPDC047465]|uniref:hypothetical protein n=1 Tax=Micromonospora sp. NPDC047465 TaxID=3154813 RepID=UPI0033FEE448
MTLAIVASVPTFFGDPGREAVIIGGLLLMIWVADLPSVPLLNRVAAALAASSIYIYLIHWQIFRPVDDISLPLALLASLAFGIAYAMFVPPPGRQGGDRGGAVVHPSCSPRLAAPIVATRFIGTSITFGRDENR